MKIEKIFSVLFILFLLSITLFGVFFTENSAEGAMRPRLFRRGGCANGSCSSGSCSNGRCVAPAKKNCQSCQNCPGGVCTKTPNTGVEIDVIIVPDVDPI